ncbi:hypothetical protein PS1_020155 [Malus domestica]
MRTQSSPTIRSSVHNLNRLSEDLNSCIRDELDVLEMEEGERVVKHRCEVYTNSCRIRLPRFWQEAFKAAYEDSGLTFKLHPLLIVSISDHYSKVKSQMHPPVTNTATPPAPNNGANGTVEAASSSSFSDSSSASCLRAFSCVIGV